MSLAGVHITLSLCWFSEKVHQRGWPCSYCFTIFTHLLSIKSSNVDDFHVSVAINI